MPPVQQGAVAGTIRLEVTELREGTRNVLGTVSLRDIVVPRQVPLISEVTFENETASGFDIVISGFSTPRDIVTATLTFAARADATLDGASSSVQLNNVFAQFYGAAASQATGSLFRGLRIPISLQGAPSP